MNLLDELGITREELINRTIEKILDIPAGYEAGNPDYDECVELTIHEEVKSQVNNSIKNIVKQSQAVIQEEIQKAIQERVSEVFTQPFQPVSRWNEPVGEPTTIRDLIAKEAETFWTTAVDKDGKPYEGGYRREQETRASYYARQTMKEYYTKELQIKADEMAKEVKDMIPDTFIAQISKSLKKYFK
jgi:hypothetical protein